VRADRLVVISGQVAIAPDGNVIGTTIEEQTQATLENCLRQLQTAGCSFADVFKVNIYLADIAEWARFNAVYQQQMPAPLPGPNRCPGRPSAGISGGDRDVAVKDAGPD
jgi:2-iminobutanoate/2-iminopropanoate deaminase